MDDQNTRSTSYNRFSEHPQHINLRRGIPNRWPIMLIRKAEITDAAAIARVHVDSWRTTYVGIVPTEHLAGLSYEQRTEEWRSTLSKPAELEFVYVAEDTTGNVIGFAWGGTESSGHPVYKAELYAIYLLEKYQRQGVGTQLLSWVVRGLLQQGVQSMLVWVLADNPSRRFYEALGGQQVSEQKITIGGVDLLEVAYGWSDVSCLMDALPY
jgi:GNAT superfamily N-acetyltransferase